MTCDVTRVAPPLTLVGMSAWLMLCCRCRALPPPLHENHEQPLPIIPRRPEGWRLCSRCLVTIVHHDDGQRSFRYSCSSCQHPETHSACSETSTRTWRCGAERGGDAVGEEHSRKKAPSSDGVARELLSIKDVIYGLGPPNLGHVEAAGSQACMGTSLSDAEQPEPRDVGRTCRVRLTKRCGRSSSPNAGGWCGNRSLANLSCSEPLARGVEHGRSSPTSIGCGARSRTTRPMPGGSSSSYACPRSRSSPQIPT